MRSLLLYASFLCASVPGYTSHILNNDENMLVDHLKAMHCNQRADATLSDVLAQPNLAFEIVKNLDIRSIMCLNQTNKPIHGMLNDNLEFKASMAQHLGIQLDKFAKAHKKTTDYFKPYYDRLEQYVVNDDEGPMKGEIVRQQLDLTASSLRYLSISPGNNYEPGSYASTHTGCKMYPRPGTQYDYHVLHSLDENLQIDFSKHPEFSHNSPYEPPMIWDHDEKGNSVQIYIDVFSNQEKKLINNLVSEVREKIFKYRNENETGCPNPRHINNMNIFEMKSDGYVLGDVDQNPFEGFIGNITLSNRSEILKYSNSTLTRSIGTKLVAVESYHYLNSFRQTYQSDKPRVFFRENGFDVTLYDYFQNFNLKDCTRFGEPHGTYISLSYDDFKTHLKDSDPIGISKDGSKIVISSGGSYYVTHIPLWGH